MEDSNITKKKIADQIFQRNGKKTIHIFIQYQM